MRWAPRSARRCGPPSTKVHRVTTEQLAILEPGLSEMVAMCMIDVMTEAVDECEKRYGIPREAAHDFLIGHLNVEIAMWFGYRRRCRRTPPSGFWNSASPRS